MTNIILKRNKEIDILAFNPNTGERLQIEVRICIRGFRLRMIDTQTKKGQEHRRGMDTLYEKKFTDPVIVNAITDFFGGEKYQKVLVVWETEGSDVIEKTKSLYGIDIWKMPDILKSLSEEVKTKAYRDKVRRTIQLLYLSGVKDDTQLLSVLLDIPEVPLFP
jgi:hypothetical protein